MEDKSKSQAALADKTNSSVSSGNPFVMPPDEELFQALENEKVRKSDLKEAAKGQKIFQKSTFSSQMHATFSSNLLDQYKQQKKSEAGLTSQSVLNTLPIEFNRKEKESMNEFIAKKRDLFLLQMALDTKKEEIRKFEQQIIQREQELKKSEAILDEDARKFDQFIKENDDMVKEAERKAEQEKNKKQEKINEIKQLNMNLASIKNELTKHEELLSECRKFKDFLDQITPVEFFEQQRLRLEAEKSEAIAKWEAQCLEIRQRKKELEEQRAVAENKYTYAQTQQEAVRAQKEIEASNNAIREFAKIQEPPMPRFEENVAEQKMFFKGPQQLLQILKELEEQNLFLIQNAQEAEEFYETLKDKFMKTQSRMESELEGLTGQVSQLEHDLKVENQKVDRIQQISQNIFQAFDQNKKTNNLEKLSEKIVEVYIKCGFDYDTSLNSVQMLTTLETGLDDYLQIIESLPKDFVEQTQKMREKMRRQQVREEKALQQQKDHEARMKRAMERAAAPVFKKVGKTLMFRSPPQRQKKIVEVSQEDNEQEELNAFLQNEMV